MFWEQCGFKMKPSTSFWSIWSSVHACATLLNRQAKFKHSPHVQNLDLRFCCGTHTSFAFSTYTTHGEVKGEPCDLSRANTQVWPWQLWGHCHIFNNWLLLESELVKMFPWTHCELQQEETLHHRKVTLMYSIRFSYHVKEHIKRKCLEKGCHNVVWWIENS